MIEQEMGVPVAILAILRHDESVRGVADRLGVTEAQVEKWKDIFVVAGTLALSKTRSARKPFAAEIDGRGFYSSSSDDPCTQPHHPCSSRDPVENFSSDPPTTSTSPPPGTTLHPEW